MVDHLFGDVPPLNPQHMAEYKDLVLETDILSSANTEIHQLNEEILVALEGPAHVYKCGLGWKLPHQLSRSI